MRVRLLAAAALAAGLLAGCGLPLPQGVQTPAAVTAEQPRQQPVLLLPKRPLPGADPLEIVDGFVRAQTSPADGFAIARQFVAPQAGWRPLDRVLVVAARPELTSTEDGADAVVSGVVKESGTVGPDGAAVVRPDGPSRTLRYRVRQIAGQWRLVELPPGLTLQMSDRNAVLPAAEVFYVAPPVPGQPPHLAADRVLLPADDEARLTLLVDRVLAGPSTALAGSVATAAAAGSTGTVTRPVGGEVAVDLSAPPRDPVALSAQLVWTLRQLSDVTRLRLSVRGAPLPGVPAVQTQDAWPEWAPEGLGLSRIPYALISGRLRPLRRLTPQEPVEVDPPLNEPAGVVDAAVHPRLSQAAVLIDKAGRRQLALGPLGGQAHALGLPDAYASPSWGSGARGLFLLRTGGAPAILLLKPGATAPVRVRTLGPLPTLSATSVLRVSHDGVRLALVDAKGTLRVGRLVVGPDGALMVSALQSLRSGVVDVAWADSTHLVALDPAALQSVVRLSVDDTEKMVSFGAEGTPVALAATWPSLPDGSVPPLLLETKIGKDLPRTYQGQDRQGLLGATRPLYPG